MALAFHSSAVVSDVSLQSAAKAAVRGAQTTVFQISQPVPVVIGKAVALTAGAVGFVVAVGAVGFGLSLLLPKAVKDYNRRNSRG